ncbi:hypothetical protein IQ266_16940 [filamentous cyanobacterium LEGE 11480]|uniref:Uncharacterized protein n=1 Tax=Romeriopsis navalis LEGE 11480 TaxID=2777977 RepID=A0A928VPL3_9CYAN|nr:hypothetical protein [Romeriopsis navalis]MBE9031422.1 hypothetical protein [Romeriopsis navalis LEGE 11480]
MAHLNQSASHQSSSKDDCTIATTLLNVLVYPCDVWWPINFATQSGAAHDRKTVFMSDADFMASDDYFNQIEPSALLDVFEDSEVIEQADQLFRQLDHLWGTEPL